VQLLAQVPGRRRLIEKEWRRRLAVAECLTFQWAREEQVKHLDKEKERQLNQLLIAEKWLLEEVLKLKNKDGRE